MKQKIVLVIAIIFIITNLVGCDFFSSSFGGKNIKVSLYFTNGDNKIVAEERNVKYGSQNDLPRVTISELLKGPKTTGYMAIIPKNTALLSSKLDSGIFLINLSKEYLNSAKVDDIIARYTIVQTICSLPGIDKVKIIVEGNDILGPDGNAIGTLGKNDVVIDSSINGKTMEYVTLYFADSNEQFLVPERRAVVISENALIEKSIVNELIKGTKIDGLSKTVPPETKLLSIETKDGICFVNLSQEFISKHWGGSTGELMTIYSIVDSLTELPNVKKVQFLIEGKKSETFIDMVFSEPFKRDQSKIRK